MDEQTRGNRGLSITVETIRRILRRLNDPQRTFVLAVDRADLRTLSEIAERAGWTSWRRAKRILGEIGEIVHDEVEFDMAYLERHGHTTWSSLLFDEEKINRRWHFKMAPELYAALVAESMISG
jgi:hypothetical protein